MEDFALIAEAVKQAREFLFEYGDDTTAHRLLALEARLRAGDRKAVVSAISETTGGMGSLNDQYLYSKKGINIPEDEIFLVNHQLSRLVNDIEKKARIAAARNGINLIR